ncbi:LOW QUALITY PROTEIN: ornithine decarboxylase antizyme 1-like [Haliotis rubra]|uniref:LOW QUALITY PROTEIN: ornithine decarboxylase antizyme 1-like n=1 Tax=Haliotis rubra TaxID=36100 RepID=UPI001EE625A1|nr:LOW QUALITY PROTEIN: ornithine decarboxylase antizyme 1-like [Haliotis rubra]
MLRASEAIVLDENFGPQSRDILASMPALQSTNMMSNQRYCISLGPGPLWYSDVPHAVDASKMSFVAEGSGVGVLAQPPVNAKGLFTTNVNSLAHQTQVAANLCFKIRPVECLEVTWETVLLDGKLYVELPCGILPEGSKESLVSLLEYAEDRLKCSHVILCFKKNRADRVNLLRVFSFLGFSVVPPGDPLVPKVEDLMFMVYVIEEDSDEGD